MKYSEEPTVPVDLHLKPYHYIYPELVPLHNRLREKHNVCDIVTWMPTFSTAVSHDVVNIPI
jgi:hypothetical protein